MPLPILISNFNAIGGITSGGDVYSYNGYIYHAFKAVGTTSFKTYYPVNIEYLVIAGGGGGSANGGGGGGAGGLLYGTRSVPAFTTYNVVVGDAGNFAGSSTLSGTNGGNSIFDNITAIGGGGGAGRDTVVNAPGVGGSGGGGGGTGGSVPRTGASGTSGQGNRGGDGSGEFGCDSAGGGGGGYTAVGTAGVARQGGNGGDGTSDYSTWGFATSTGQNISGTYWFCGGGAGGTTNFSGCNASTVWNQGQGGKGGGAGKNSLTRILNSGGGGCGTNASSDGTQASTQGGTGVVIVRYAA